MSGFLDIARAAKSAGVSRLEIQKRIADGDLPSFEGKVDYDVLARLYPLTSTSVPGMLEYVEGLKEAALHKTLGADSHQPNETLEQAYARVCHDLEHARTLARDRLILLKDTERMLGQLEVDVRPPQRVRALAQWLKVRLKRDNVR
jgi:CDP-4-dehydro-6-deoxyglucose reductase, E3